MAVPTFTLLTEAQFDPGKPMTQEIGLALWRNWMAVFGIDDTDASPVLTLAPSAIRTVATTIYQTKDTTLTTDNAISDLAAACETNIQMRAAGDGAPYSGYGPHCHVGNNSVGYMDFDITGLDCNYSGGSPNGVNMTIIQYARAFSGGSEVFSALSNLTPTATVVPLDNAWHDLIGNGSNVFFSAKARSSSGILYLQLKMPTVTTSTSYINFINTRKAYLYKG